MSITAAKRNKAKLALPTGQKKTGSQTLIVDLGTKT